MGYNLISVLKDISTKIGNIVVHDPGTNIDGVATAITNKTIPDPTTELGNIVTALQNINIQTIATDSVAVDGSRWNPAGNYVADLDLFWEGLGHVNTSTLNHPQSNGHGIVIAARNGAGAIQIYIPIDAYTDNTNPTIYMRFTQYADLGNWVNPWDYLYIDSYYAKYDDPYNIGASNARAAINYLVDKKVTKPNYDYQIPQMTVDQSGVNCNNLKNFGYYQISNATNTPNNGSGWYTIMTIPMGSNNTNYCHQFAINLNNPALWHRYCNNGTWSSWTTI